MAEAADFATGAVRDWMRLRPELDVTTDELTVFVRLSRLVTLMDDIDENSLRPFEAHGIRGIDDFLTLSYMRRTAKGLSNTELIGHLRTSKAGMSARLDRFVAHGICERTASPLDRRLNTNTLTHHGVELTDRMADAVTRGRKSLSSTLAPDQLRALSTTLADMIATISPTG